ncbi:hypothetical protein [Companilactobacillus metriopterae]|uniref:hypothetical protein n=1 Tax=Companilactobacillus metriopterae TaxID=1909267 RepID=UPI00100B3E67|nr:hypothetical protein [Companilactobacillus metriopterae]
MTSHSTMFKALFKQKMRYTGTVGILWVLGTIVMSLFAIGSSNNIIDSITVIASSWGSLLLTFGMLIGLTFADYGIFNNNRYRLVPISDSKLYLANIESSILAMIISFAVYLFGLALLQAHPVIEAMNQVIKEMPNIPGDAYLAFILILLIIALNVVFFVSIVDFLIMGSLYFSHFVADRYQKVARFGLFVILAIVCSYLFDSATTLINNYSNFFDFLSNQGSLQGLSIGLLITVALVAVFVVIDIYVLPHIEADK